jgi:hypothetical protein
VVCIVSLTVGQQAQQLFQLECAIRLFQWGDLPVNDNISVHGKAIMKTPRKVNKASGKDSANGFAFLEQNWGACTRQYLLSISRHDDTVLQEIVDLVNTLVASGMDMIVEDGSCEDPIGEELTASANQCINICRIASQMCK